MKAALAHINSDGTIWLTRVETIAPDFNTFELLRLSVSDLRTLMQSQGYYEVYRFNARPALHVFVHDGLDEIDLTNAILTRPGESLIDKIRSERKVEVTESTFPQHVGQLSDRAIQRLVGGDAFLRGRIYARRGSVSDLQADPHSATCRVLIRADEPIDVSAGFGPDNTIQSKCSCQAWRGPTGHCKHVAALLVALRMR